MTVQYSETNVYFFWPFFSREQLSTLYLRSQCLPSQKCLLWLWVMYRKSNWHLPSGNVVNPFYVYRFCFLYWLDTCNRIMKQLARPSPGRKYHFVTFVLTMLCKWRNLSFIDIPFQTAQVYSRFFSLMLRLLISDIMAVPQEKTYDRESILFYQVKNNHVTEKLCNNFWV